MSTHVFNRFRFLRFVFEFVVSLLQLLKQAFCFLEVRFRLIYFAC